MPTRPVTLEALKAKFGDLAVSEFRDQTRVVVPVEKLQEVFRFLHDERNFKMIVDVTCVDYLKSREEVPARFGLVYQFADVDANERIILRTYIDEPDLKVPSAVPFWTGADWLEREAYDMFGIIFEGHPDLRRILLPDEFTSFPLRKDYPLQGKGERHNFPVVSRDRS